MAAAGGLGRCPSIPQNAGNMTRQSSLVRQPSCLQRATSLVFTGRRSSVDCFAAQRPEAQEPERLPDEYSATDWSDLGLSAMPWPLHAPGNLERESFAEKRGPVMFYPAADRDVMSAQELEDAGPQPSANTTCHVILFGVKEKYETEGIYTLRTTDSIRGDDLIQADTVVAFETEVDAQRFATLLEAVITYSPTVFPIAWGDITQWCEENDTRLRLEAGGSLLIPPETSVAGDSDWERALRLQRGEFQVLDYEPHDVQASGPATSAEPREQDAWAALQRFKESAAEDTSLAPGFFIDGPQWVYEDPNGMQEPERREATRAIVDTKLAQHGVDAVRLGLERLLPKEEA